jgi:hypothetical protein
MQIWIYSNYAFYLPFKLISESNRKGKSKFKKKENGPRWPIRSRPRSRPSLLSRRARSGTPAHRPAADSGARLSACSFSPMSPPQTRSSPPPSDLLPSLATLTPSPSHPAYLYPPYPLSPHPNTTPISRPCRQIAPRTPADTASSGRAIARCRRPIRLATTTIKPAIARWSLSSL